MRFCGAYSDARWAIDTQLRWECVAASCIAVDNSDNWLFLDCMWIWNGSKQQQHKEKTIKILSSKSAVYDMYNCQISEILISAAGSTTLISTRSVSYEIWNSWWLTEWLVEAASSNALGDRFTVSETNKNLLEKKL